MKFKYIDTFIFDYDGTIINSPDRQFKWLQFWAEENNVLFDFKSFEEFKPIYADLYLNKGIQGVYDELHLPCDMKNKSHPVHDAYEYFNLTFFAPFYEGIVDVFEHIQSAGGKIAICTNTHSPIVEKGLSDHNIPLDSFPIIDARTVVKEKTPMKTSYYTKPSTKLIEHTLIVLNSHPVKAMHICDTLVDVSASLEVPFGEENYDLTNVGHLGGYEGDILRNGVVKNNSRKYFDELYSSSSELINIIDSYA
jgi:FMN phosphatase YigB (HAD superfamily)